MSKLLTTEEFIKKAIKIHNNTYDYFLVEYKNNYTKVKIICKEHGIFEMKPMKHNSGSKCPKCSLTYKKNTQQYMDEIKIVHNNKYDYSKLKYNGAKSKVKIKCFKHGMFDQTPNNHLTKKYGCPKCKSSKGEIKIRKYLKENDIKFEEQKTFNDCLSSKNSKLKFDFYLLEQHICIEYDGIQHYKIVEYFGGRSSFMKIKHRDKLKDKYCQENNIRLIRIPYTDFDKIDEKIKSKLFFYFFV